MRWAPGLLWRNQRIPAAGGQDAGGRLCPLRPSSGPRPVRGSLPPLPPCGRRGPAGAPPGSRGHPVPGVPGVPMSSSPHAWPRLPHHRRLPGIGRDLRFLVLCRFTVSLFPSYHFMGTSREDNMCVPQAILNQSHTPGSSKLYCHFSNNSVILSFSL